MSAKCMYHPTQVAHFICPKCKKGYCPDCITKRVVDGYAGKETYYICPKCNEEADTVPVGDLVAPFWNRLHYFFIYPMHIQPLILILVLSGLDFIMFDVRAQFLLYCIIVQYSYAVLTNTAHGRLKPPGLASSVLSGGMIDLIVPAVKQMLLLGLGVSSFFVVGSYAGPTGSVVAAGIFVLLLPAMIMVLVANNSIMQAVNPLVLAAVIYRIGWMYLLMLLFLALTIGAPMSLTGYLGEFMSPGTVKFIQVVAAKYYTIMMYNMMGYVLLQYHDEIGFEVDYEAFQKQTEGPAKNKKKKKLSPREQLLEEVAQLVRDDDIDEAISLIRRETEGDFKDFVLAERYYKLLKIGKRTEELLEHSHVYLNYLLRRGDKSTAVEVYNDCLALKPDYAPEPEQIKKLAEWMVQAGEVQKGIKMLIRFTKTNNDHPLVPEVYLLMARLFREKMKNVKKAKEILHWLLRKYPDHALRPLVQRYLQTISRPPPKA